MLERGAGKMFVRADGKVFYFCRSKCQKNWDMGRVGKEHKWTRLYRGSGKPEPTKPKPGNEVKKVAGK